VSRASDPRVELELAAARAGLRGGRAQELANGQRRTIGAIAAAASVLISA